MFVTPRSSDHESDDELNVFAVSYDVVIRGMPVASKWSQAPVHFENSVLGAVPAYSSHYTLGIDSVDMY